MRIREELTKLGFAETEFRVYAGTGMTVDLCGTGPEAAVRRVIALRADMDALPMTELTGLPHASRHPGAAHECGHDGHMATLLAVVRLVASRRDRLPCNHVLRMLWQPAEEGPGGAEPMVREGCMAGVDEVYGYHNWPAFPFGNCHIVAGPAMAHVSDVDIVVRGRGGHASQPHLTADPVVAAAHAIVAAQTVVSRSVHALQPAVVSLCTIHGGEVRNVIPDQVRISGTIRDLDEGVAATIAERLPVIVSHSVEAHGCTAVTTVR